MVCKSCFPSLMDLSFLFISTLKTLGRYSPFLVLPFSTLKLNSFGFSLLSGFGLLFTIWSELNAQGGSSKEQRWGSACAADHWLLRCAQSQSRPTFRTHGLQSARLLCPWESPGKNTNVSTKEDYSEFMILYSL